MVKPFNPKSNQMCVACFILPFTHSIIPLVFLFIHKWIIGNEIHDSFVLRNLKISSQRGNYNSWNDNNIKLQFIHRFFHQNQSYLRPQQLFI